VLGSWMQDMIPQTLYDNMHKMDELYTFDSYHKTLKDIIEGYVNDRIIEFKEVKTAINTKKS
jgi:carbamoylphosphate synthase large subunit